MNGYQYWQVPSIKLLLSKFESNPFISLQVTMPESNQLPNFLQRWKKVNFLSWLNTTFCLEKPYQKPRPSSINIIWTQLRRIKWFRSCLPNFVVVVWAQKPYQIQVVQMRSLHQKWSIKSMILYPSQLSVWSLSCIHICKWESSVQYGCRDCSQSTKHVFLWPLLLSWGRKDDY